MSEFNFYALDASQIIELHQHGDCPGEWDYVDSIESPCCEGECGERLPVYRCPVCGMYAVQ